ncbi:isochorismate synthase DhbC [Priestia endophytica]|uniref:isochorismate synthase DhbC n=1 Tax=Priestia endophytica TaxID=135735 RepID=UPI003D29466E
MKQSVIEQATKPLLEQYEKGDFFFSSPTKTLLGKGKVKEVPFTERNEIPSTVKELLHNAKQQGNEKPIAVGAIPFLPSQPSKLIIPEHVHIEKTEKVNENDFSNEDIQYEVRSFPSGEEYEEGVKAGLQSIREGEINKIVLARSLLVSASKAINVPELLYKLASKNQHGYTFAANVSDEVDNKTLVGASPELLIAKHGNQIISNPLAGSRPRSKDPIEDKRRSEELLSSEKDLYEHAFVVQEIARALKPYCKNLHVPEKPELLHTETMWHLSTEITGEVVDDSISSLDLAHVLHPTPAVCGTPTEQARQKIQDIEPFDRSFFTGTVGWCDENGDGEWIVTIRCAEVLEESLRLFAGAGIVEGSIPSDERAETAAKFKTMLRAMGINEEEKE